MSIDSLIRYSISAASVLTLALALAGIAHAEPAMGCDTGFDMLSLRAENPDDSIVYFVCAEGGYYGDPDLGWSRESHVSPDGREVRVEAENVARLRAAGVVR